MTKETIDEIQEVVKTKILLPINEYEKNTETFQALQPFFYTENHLFWFWEEEKYKYTLVDEVGLLNAIVANVNLTGTLCTSTIRNAYLNAFMMIGRRNVRKETEEQKNWIQFKDKIFNVKTRKIIDATPQYFLTNPIPHALGKSTQTPTMDKLFTEWVGAEHIQTLYEIISYCCLYDMPIHLIFALIGGGRNGKTQFLKIVRKYLGKENVSSTELDVLLENRFETTKLYKKLCCVLGETNFGTMKKTSMLKKLSGGDLVGFEYKNKQPFDAESYCKIIVASNSLPSSMDTSEGFYRRWLLVKFEREFPEGKDIIETIPEEEYRNLSLKITAFAPMIVHRGKIHGMGTIEERQKAFEEASNPIKIFIDEFCIKKDDAYIKYSDFYSAYMYFLKTKKRRRISYKEFNDGLLDEGYFVYNTSKKINEQDNIWLKDRWIEGLGFNKINIGSLIPVGTGLSIHSIYIDSDINICPKEHKCPETSNSLKDYVYKGEIINLKDYETAFYPCQLCGITPEHSSIYFIDNKYICEICLKLEVEDTEMKT